MRRLSGALVVVVAVAVAVAVAACSGPPTELDDAGDRFAWSPAVSGLDEALLSVCTGGGTTVAVGGTGGRAMVLEWTGTAWYAPPLPDGADVLWWCWIDDLGQPWAVGESATILRRDGAGVWRRQQTFGAVAPQVTLFGIWGTSATDLWVVGGLPTGVGVPAAIAHFDGEVWLPEQPGNSDVSLFKVWGTSSDDVWAVGTGGFIHHRGPAGTWTAMLSPEPDRLIAVYGRAADDVYAVGGDGAGLVLRWDGTSWATWATAPEALSGVWTAPDQPLFVAGNRGYVARHALGAEAGAPARDIRIVAADVDLHALTGMVGDGGPAVLASGSDLVGGGASSWRGAVFAHGASFSGDVVRPPPIDAGPDGGGDAMDAGTDGPDAAPAPGPGEECNAIPPLCAEGLECWNLLTSGVFLCTEVCGTADTCVDYVDPCCVLPGFQALDKVCIPGSYTECE